MGAEATNNDDKGFLTFCATIGSLIALTIFVLSIYGIVDASNETSLKKAEQIEQIISDWKDIGSDQFINDFYFTITSDEILKSEAVEKSVRSHSDNTSIESDIDSRFVGSKDWLQYELSEYPVRYHEALINGTSLYNKFDLTPRKDVILTFVD